VRQTLLHYQGERAAASLTGNGGFEAIGVAPVPNLIWKPSEVSCQSATIETVKALVIAFLVCCPSGTRGRKQKHSHSYGANAWTLDFDCSGVIIHPAHSAECGSKYDGRTSQALVAQFNANARTPPPNARTIVVGWTIVIVVAIRRTIPITVKTMEVMLALIIPTLWPAAGTCTAEITLVVK